MTHAFRARTVSEPEKPKPQPTHDPTRPEPPAPTPVKPSDKPPVK
jgi:hypothetical protein